MKRTVFLVIALSLVCVFAWAGPQIDIQGYSPGQSVESGAAPALLGTNITGTASGLTVGNVSEGVTLKAPVFTSGTSVYSDTCAADNTAAWYTSDAGNLTFSAVSSCYVLTRNNISARAFLPNDVAWATVGEMYKISVDLKDGTASNVTFKLGTFNGSAAEMLSITSTTSTGWVTYNLYDVITSGAERFAGVLIPANMTGVNIQLRNFSITKMPITVRGDAYFTGTGRFVVSSYTGNDAAARGGLVTGQLYLITGGDTLGIVH